jgi:hypothetical protein
MSKTAFIFNLRRYYIKTTSWEYWPMWVVYFPVSFYYIFLAIKARSFFFFSASNPTIETGGMFFESKWKIFQLIPQKYFPSTIYIEEKDSLNIVLNKLNTEHISFPIIAKPDRGERGWCVQKINNEQELNDYINKIHIPFLIQAYVDYPLEFSVFYFRSPNKHQGKVTSVTLKKLLTVQGDGSSNIEQLILKNNRAFLQYHLLKKNKSIDFNKVLKKDEEMVLVPYGNHVLGAMFINYNHIIDEQLCKTFDDISRQIDGFYFGRFDLRCTSIDDLKQGKSISILELNGAGAEPAHIYDPGFSFIKAQQVIAQHYKMLYQASATNNKNGVAYMSYTDFKSWRQQEKECKQKQGF